MAPPAAVAVSSRQSSLAGLTSSPPHTIWRSPAFSVATISSQPPSHSNVSGAMFTGTVTSR